MRLISEAAARTLDKLRVLAVEADGECPHIKLDNGGEGIMPITVERLHFDGAAELWAVGHWYTQNGDAMRDPEVVFLRVPSQEPVNRTPAPGLWCPVEFRQDGLGMSTQVLVNFKPHSLAPLSYFKARQADVAKFCHLWMGNVRHQQRLA